MPITGMDNIFYHHAGWQRRFAYWPHKCLLNNTVIWLKYAYRGTVIWTGPGHAVSKHQWHSADAHLIWKLKGK